jgi:Rod binding domain-containing protein
LTLPQRALDAEAQASPEQRRVAAQFEAIFLRQLLRGLETSSGLGQEEGSGRVYRSMMVGALADSAADGGGIGLSDLVLRAMLGPAPARSGDAQANDAPAEADGPPAAAGPAPENGGPENSGERSSGERSSGPENGGET